MIPLSEPDPVHAVVALIGKRRVSERMAARAGLKVRRVPPHADQTNEFQVHAYFVEKVPCFARTSLLQQNRLLSSTTATTWPSTSFDLRRLFAIRNTPIFPESVLFLAHRLRLLYIVFWDYLTQRPSISMQLRITFHVIYR